MGGGGWYGAQRASQIESGMGKRTKRSVMLVVLVAVLAAVAIVGVVSWIAGPFTLDWRDRRPIGVLFLADTSHASLTNPRGWFNQPRLDVRGAEGAETFRKALLAYADRSIAILKQTHAQGAVVWDLEGEQYPQKISYIGDPRVLDRQAPEMALAVDEFLGRLRAAGLRIGMTIRPQRLVFGSDGNPQQTEVPDWDRVLLEKIDYARKRWGASLFYIDSNAGIRDPDELFRLRRVAEARPDVLLIPEHHEPLYRAFSAPYRRLRDQTAFSVLLERSGSLLYSRSFEALNIADAGQREAEILAARDRGDVLLFPAWVRSAVSVLLTEMANEGSAAGGGR